MIEVVTTERELAKSPTRTAGSQTLARGLEALKAVAASREGVAVADVAEHLGVHRTIAYRLLNTLVDARLVHRGEDGRFRGAAGLNSLAASAYDALRASAQPVIRECVDELGATIALIVQEGSGADAEAVALDVASPKQGIYHIAFTEGSRHDLDRGAAGRALRAAGPRIPSEPSQVTETRKHGFSRTFGEVEEGMHGVAVPFPADIGVTACLNLITTQERTAARGVAPLQRAVAAIASRLRTAR